MTNKKKILAISSGGGHWVELMRVTRAFEGNETVFVTVSDAYASDVGDARLHVINDATRWDKVGLVRMALKILWILIRERPDVVISTGAAPGYFGIRMGKFLGARTIWIDSIANVDSLSMSGERVSRWADLWLTQWPHLATARGPDFKGAVL